MQKTVLNDVFELLVQIGAVSSESEFSKDWLCRSECYMRTLRFKRVKPSVGTLAICASKLQHYGRCMTATEQHTQLGKRFIELSEQCHKQINTGCCGVVERRGEGLTSNTVASRQQPRHPKLGFKQ